MSAALRAVDVQALANRLGAPNTHIDRLCGLPLEELPVTTPVLPEPGSPRQAVVSWRWDIDPCDGTSRNVAAALLHAIERQVQLLFMDKVSIDQSLSGMPLMDAVVAFSQLFGTLPTLAAHDTRPLPGENRHFLRTLRRPWIAREVEQMQFNLCGIDYIGHLADGGVGPDFGFAHMSDRIWRSSFANSLLYVLTGFCGMHATAELPLLLPEHATLLSAAAGAMGRNDALLAAAILSQTASDDDRVNGDLDIRTAEFQAFRFEAVEDSLGYWCNWHVMLGGNVAATWSEKDFTRDGDHRRKLTPAADARQVIGRHLGVVGPQATASAPPRDALRGSSAEIRVFDLSARFGAAG